MDRQVIGRIEDGTLYAEPQPEPDQRDLLDNHERVVARLRREHEASERRYRQRLAIIFGIGIVYGASIASFGA